MKVSKKLSHTSDFNKNKRPIVITQKKKKNANENEMKFPSLHDSMIHSTGQNQTPVRIIV